MISKVLRSFLHQEIQEILDEVSVEKVPCLKDYLIPFEREYFQDAYLHGWNYPPVASWGEYVCQCEQVIYWYDWFLPVDQHNEPHSHWDPSLKSIGHRAPSIWEYWKVVTISDDCAILVTSEPDVPHAPSRSSAPIATWLLTILQTERSKSKLMQEQNKGASASTLLLQMMLAWVNFQPSSDLLQW